MNTWWKKHLTSPFINYFGRRKESIHFSKGPILIGGCGRSGTTLLLSILSAHPRIHAIPVETDAFTSWNKNGTPERLDRLYRQLLLNEVSPASQRWCEKRPYNVRYIPEILSYFGSDARFIHLIRDPRAVCSSVHPSKPGEYWIPIERYVVDVCKGLEHIDDPQVLTIRYEDLISDIDTELKKILHFLGEPYTHEMTHWYKYATVRKSNAWFGQLTPLDASRASSWKSESNQDRVEAISDNDEIRKLMSILHYA